MLWYVLVFTASGRARSSLQVGEGESNRIWDPSNDVVRGDLGLDPFFLAPPQPPGALRFPLQMKFEPSDPSELLRPFGDLEFIISKRAQLHYLFSTLSHGLQ